MNVVSRIYFKKWNRICYFIGFFEKIKPVGFIFIFLFAIQASFSQISYDGKPYFPSMTQLRLSANPSVFKMPSFDLDSVLLEDELEGFDTRSYRFAHKFYTNIEKKKDANMSILPDGTKIWTLTIHSDSAYSLNFLLEDVSFPEGGQLFIYNTDYSHVIGKFDRRNVSESGRLPIRPVEGESIIVEYSEPANVEFEGNFRITEVNHDYRNFLRREPYPDPSKSDCMPDVLCEEIDSALIRSTVLLMVNGTIACTGTLLNNTEEDGVPYVLTALHCLDASVNISRTMEFYEGRAGTIITFFNYERTACETTMKGTEQMSVAGSYLRVAMEKRDVALLELQNIPPDYYNAYYAGWNLSDVTNDNPYHNIHHPNGALKKYGRRNGSISASTLTTGGYTFANSGHWMIAGWTVGSTAGGSSGSALFDKENLLVGALTAGSSECSGNNPNNGSDYFYRFAQAWKYNADTMGELKTFLNPMNQTITHCLGYDPHQSNPIFRLSNIDYASDGIRSSTLQSPYSGNAFGGDNSPGATEFAEAFYTEKPLNLMGAYLLIPPMAYNLTDGITVSVYKGTSSPEGQPVASYNFNPRFINYSSLQNFFEQNVSTGLYGTENFVLFTGDLKVDGNFYISYRLAPSSSNLFRVFNTEYDSQNANTAWIKDSGGTWTEAKNYSPYGKSASLAILPLVSEDKGSGIGSPESRNRKTSVSMSYISSASTFKLSTTDLETGSLRIYSVMGQLLEEFQLQPGKDHYEIIKMKKGNIGIARLVTNNAHYSMKFIY